MTYKTFITWLKKTHKLDKITLQWLNSNPGALKEFWKICKRETHSDELLNKHWYRRGLEVDYEP